MMNGKETQQQWAKPLASNNQAAAGRAVVIGSSIAGLMATQVLLPFFDQVTIIDRDRLPETAEFRNGVPQARHPHTLLRRGQLILEQRFPGLTNELLARGAMAIDAERELALFREGEWQTPGQHEDTLAISGSRPLLESTIYRRVAAQPKVKVLASHEAICLSLDGQRGQVAGIQVRNRLQPRQANTWLGANLVIDASGRQSHAPQWLNELGYAPPAELTVNARLGYATRIYRRPDNQERPWQAMYIQPEAPDKPRGAMIMPMEDNRWHVTLIGMNGDYPPTDESSFMDFARSLPTPVLYESIAEAEPLTKPIGYRRTESRLRAYDQLPHYLEGFLVYGDAVIAMNPLYAQGMTAVALGSLALEQALQAHSHDLAQGRVTGLAATFQKELAAILATPWQMAERADLRWSNTAVYSTQSLAV
jgi:2-polyprenyl-6-methoxyphenol hydroxylase-like FAD-dependent oxidoreductase